MYPPASESLEKAFKTIKDVMKGLETTSTSPTTEDQEDSSMTYLRSRGRVYAILESLERDAFTQGVRKSNSEKESLAEQLRHELETERTLRIETENRYAVMEEEQASRDGLHPGLKDAYDAVQAITTRILERSQGH